MSSTLPHHLERIVMMASEQRWEEVRACLLELNNQDPADMSLLMLRLSFFGRTSWIAPLKALGADPTYQSDVGDTALGECISGSARRMPTFFTAVRLLEIGADPNEVTRGGNRILQLAIAEDRPEFVSLLLLKGADPRLTSPDPDHPSAFDVAKSYGANRAWAIGLLDRVSTELNI